MRLLYKFCDTIENTPLLFKNNKVYLATKDGVFELSDSIDSIQIVNKRVDSYKVLKDNTILYQIENGKEFFYCNIIYKGNYYLNRMIELDDYILISGKETDKRLTFKIKKDFTQKSIVSYKYFPTKIINNRDYIFNGAIFLSLCSFDNNSEHWNIDFTEKSKYQDEKGNWQTGNINKIEVFEDTLVVLLGNDVLIGLDINTGKIKWELAMPTRIITPADFSDGKIYWFSLGNNPLYQIIDMKTGKIGKSIVPPVEITERLIFTRPNIYKDWLLITSVSTHEIFVLDKQTLKLENITKIDGCKNRIPIDNAPQIAGNRVYQLDGDSTLHVFEMENL